MPTRLTLTAGPRLVAFGKRGKTVRLPNGRTLTIGGPDGRVRLAAGETRTFREVRPIDPLAIRSDFLTDAQVKAAVGRTYTHILTALHAPEQRRAFKAIATRYSHVNLYVHNEQDYRGPSFSGYANPALMVDTLTRSRAAGLLNVTWLEPDDAPWMNHRSVGQVQKMYDDLVPRIDHLSDVYVLGLEHDEYRELGDVHPLGTHLRTLTKKPILVHLMGGQWGSGQWSKWRQWATGLAYQYENPHERDTSAHVEARTRQLVPRLARDGMVLIASEYGHKVAESKTYALGEAALKGGATGFMNGGPSHALN